MTAQLALPLITGAPDLVARLRQLGLPPTTAIGLHENRRVMVSFDRAGTLRVHRGYAFAPDHIIAALAEWARPRLRRVDRRAAARVFLEFQVHQFVPPKGPRRSVADTGLPGDLARLDRLVQLHYELNRLWFGGHLRPIRIDFSSRMRRKLGHYEPRREGAAAIVIGRRHLKRDGWARVAETLLHEMVHQWQDENGLPVDHGAEFRRKAREVGISPRAATILS